MAAEIERKFLVKEGWQPQTEGVRIAQGYLSSVPERTVRVRIKGEKGFLTVKGRNEGTDVRSSSTRSRFLMRRPCSLFASSH